MNRTIRLLAAAVLAASGAAPALASGDPQDSFVYQNMARACEVLDRAIAAHGPSLVDRSVTFRVAYTGTFIDENHLARPWTHRDNALTGTTLYSAEFRAVRSEGSHAEAKPQPFFAILGEGTGVRLDPGADKPKVVADADVERAFREELEILPHEYLRQARAGAAGLRLLKGAKGYDVLTYTMPNGENRALYLTSESHLLVRVEHFDHWRHKGDRLEWRSFSDYADRSGVKVPRRSEAHVERESTQRNVITEITTFELAPPTTAADFKLPEAFRAGFETWSLPTPEIDPSAEPLPTRDLGNGAYIVELADSDSRSLLIAFSDFSVVVEAGDRSELGQRILATADRLLPGKPVRYVAMSHHHPLYASGLRPYAQRGVTILTTAGNVSYLRDLTTRPYRIRPDAQQRRPREPRIEVIDGKRVIEDGTQRLELHTFAGSMHVDEFVIAYLPSHKLIVSGDLVYILRGDAPKPASGREKAIARAVLDLGLDVESIMQTWFLATSEHLTPYAQLREKVRLADEKAATN